MSIGFNSRVQRAEGAYDVQTEDRGASRPFIDTVVVMLGQVLYRRSVNYADLLGGGAADPVLLRERAERQHLEILEALRTDSLPLQEAASSAIQVKLLNAAGWLVNGQVALEIQVCARASGEAVPGATVEAGIEGATDASGRFSGTSNAEGRVRIEFPFPALANSGSAALVIFARTARAQDQLRYNLKATPKISEPKVP